MSLIEFRDVSVRFGAVCALNHVSLKIEAGTTTAIVGANGAGKSTLLRALVGLDKASEGRILYRDTDITNWTPERRSTLGMALSPEGRRLFPDMSVRDNLLTGAYRRRDRAQISRDLARILDTFPSLARRHLTMAGKLSGGEQQMCAIGRAVMAAPEVLLLDEPSLGLSPAVVQDVARAIRGIADSGVTIVLVEQNSRLALSLSDSGHVFDSGKLVMSASAAQLLNDPHVVKAYLGESL